MSLSKATKQVVRERTSNCCEYCRLPASAGTVEFHVDHFIPLKHDGSDDIDNLCYACFNSNMYKSHDLTGFDPATGEITPLFNPRKHTWEDHFVLQASTHPVIRIRRWHSALVVTQCGHHSSRRSLSHL